MKSFFYGWYFKCQSDTQTFAVIPAIHQGKNGRTCSIQSKRKIASTCSKSSDVR